MAAIHEVKTLRNRYHAFRDRFHAGEVLGQMLASPYESGEGLIVLAIPSGGVPVGLKVRERLTGTTSAVRRLRTCWQTCERTYRMD